MFDPALRAGTGRRRKPGQLVAVLLAAGSTATALFGAATPAGAAPGGDAWYRLRVCESGNNYRTNTGNGYYGAYQFTAGTWHAYGGAGLPSSAAPAEQDYRAKLLYRASGWAPWPACSRRLGLGANPAYGRTGARPARAVTHRPTPAPARAGTATSRSHRRSAVTPRRPSPRPAEHRPTAYRPVGHRVARHPAVIHRPVIHRPARVAVWSAPDGGRWGRPAALLVPGTGHRTAAIRLLVAAFESGPSWTGIVRPL
jgi:hypothetical protein